MAFFERYVELSDQTGTASQPIEIYTTPEKRVGFRSGPVLPTEQGYYTPPTRSELSLLYSPNTPSAQREPSTFEQAATTGTSLLGVAGLANKAVGKLTGESLVDRGIDAGKNLLGLNDKFLPTDFAGFDVLNKANLPNIPLNKLNPGSFDLLNRNPVTSTPIEDINFGPLNTIPEDSIINTPIKFGVGNSFSEPTKGILSKTSDYLFGSDVPKTGFSSAFKSGLSPTKAAVGSALLAGVPSLIEGDVSGAIGTSAGSYLGKAAGAGIAGAAGISGLIGNTILPGVGGFVGAFLGKELLESGGSVGPNSGANAKISNGMLAFNDAGSDNKGNAQFATQFMNSAVQNVNKFLDSKDMKIIGDSLPIAVEVFADEIIVQNPYGTKYNFGKNVTEALDYAVDSVIDSGLLVDSASYSSDYRGLSTEDARKKVSDSKIAARVEEGLNPEYADIVRKTTDEQDYMRYNAAPEAKKLLQQKIVDRERNAREVAAQRASGILPEISSEDQQKIDRINSALERLGPLGNIGAI